MDFTVFSKTEMEEMFQAMLEHMPEDMKELSIKEFGSIEQWKEHYLEVVSREEMQKNYAKVVEWYGGKEEYLSAAKNPVSKEVAESYTKRIAIILEKMITKINCPVDSFEVKELVAEYGFVMKQFSQMKEERGMMLSVAHSYQGPIVRAKINEKYGDGAAEFFAEAIESFYKG